MMYLFKIITCLFCLYIDNLKRIVNISKMSYLNKTCQLSRKCSLNRVSLGKYVTVFGDTVITKVDIGDYSYLQTHGRIFNCSIGKFCSIAPSVTIAPGIHDISCVTTHPSLVQRDIPLPKVLVTKNNIVDFKKVIIGHDVWIGEKAIILDGITIGNGAVIAAGAVVNQNVEPYSVVGGVPARHIKFRFDAEVRKSIENSHWWDKPEEWFMEHDGIMLDPQHFLETI